MQATNEQDDRAKPYASWSSLAFGLIALGLGLWVLLSGDVIDNFVHPPKDDPLLIASLVHGILGTLAGIVGVARREPLRLALLGLGISLVAVLAKFFLAALLIVVVVLVAVALLGGIG